MFVSLLCVELLVIVVNIDVLVLDDVEIILHFLSSFNICNIFMLSKLDSIFH